MPTFPVPDVALVRVEGIVDNQLTINTTHWQVSGGGINAVNLATITSAVSAWARSTLAALLSDDWSITRTVGIDLTTATGVTFEDSSVATGAVSGEAAPNNVAACVSFRTAQRGRSYRGRNFVPGISNGDITLNTLDPTFITNLVSAYQTLIGAGTFTAGWQWGVVSRRQGGVDISPPLFIPITSVSMVGNKVRSMRSREVGHGA